MKRKGKGILRGIVTLALVFGMLLNSTCTQAMEPTGCKNFAEMKKRYAKQAEEENFGALSHSIAYYATGKLKTKFGTKKALFLHARGSVVDIEAYVKEGDEVYFVDSFSSGSDFMISKNSKYVVDSFSGCEVNLYKYSKGEYKKVKYYNGDKEKQLKKWKKKYNMYIPKFKEYAIW